MGRYLGPKCRLCRREGVKLFLKGDRCFSPKCPIERRGAVPPGVHGRRRTGKLSDYGRQLREKQKTKRLYGLSETQFHNLFKLAAKQRKNTGLRLLQLLESRLDNIVFRGQLAPSRSVARQLVSHGHVLVDGKKVNIPSYRLKPGQVVSLAPKALDHPLVKKILAEKSPLPDWLEKKGAAVKFKRLPERKEMPADINEDLIVEFYSR